jgi:hypothetical protein
MQALGAVSFFAFVIASGLIGFRLLFLWRRTRELPELAISLAHLLGGFFGYGLLVAVTVLRWLPTQWNLALYILALVSMCGGAFSVALFTFAVFRPEARWAGGLLALLLALFAAGVLGSTLEALPMRTNVGLLSFWGITLGTGTSYGWATVESLRYRRLLLRRARVGLGDPLVANRLLLWAWTEGLACSISLLYAATRLLDVPQSTPAVSSAAALLVLLSSVTSWLAFFPPETYRRWVGGPARAAS